MGTVLKGDISVVENGLKVMSLDNGEREEVHTLKYYGIGINEIMKERQKLGYLKKTRGEQYQVLCRDQRKD